jgi:predicted lipoprotein with Yx(FWY)xxD motif
MRRLVPLLGLLVVGCGAPATTGPITTASPPSAVPTIQSSSPSPSAASSAAPSPTPSKSREAVGTKIIAADSNFGRMLYDASGQAIYLFDAEKSDRPRCYGDCAKAWPPVLTKGRPRATGAVRSTLLGTTRRSDGSVQITYAGHPLYFYAHEGKHQVLCHNVQEFGGTWLVVQPDGKPAAA